LLIPRAIVIPMQAEKLFAIFEEFFNHASTPGAALVDKVHATYTFEIFPEKVGSGESKKWTIDLNTKPGKCTPQEVRQPLALNDHMPVVFSSGWW
ncbi:hypothetical protein FOZ63_024894, partial [Perkinsus olseni]